MTIGTGLPTGTTSGLHISMVQFHPGSPRTVYSKGYLHSDEEPFFVAGTLPKNPAAFFGQNPKVALAICYEISVPEHSQNASRLGADAYVASAAKTVEGTEIALGQLSAIASTHRMAVMLSNYVGESGDNDCGGRSSVWNDKGELLGQLSATDEGVLLYDTVTTEVAVRES